MSVELEREREDENSMSEEYSIYGSSVDGLCVCARRACMHFKHGQNPCSECDAKNCVYKIQYSLRNLLNRMETERRDGKQNDFHYFQFYHLLFSLILTKKTVTQLCERTSLFPETRILVHVQITSTKLRDRDANIALQKYSCRIE